MSIGRFTQPRSGGSSRTAWASTKWVSAATTATAPTVSMTHSALAAPSRASPRRAGPRWQRHHVDRRSRTGAHAHQLGHNPKRRVTCAPFFLRAHRPRWEQCTTGFELLTSIPRSTVRTAKARGAAATGTVRPLQEFVPLVENNTDVIDSFSKTSAAALVQRGPDTGQGPDCLAIPRACRHDGARVWLPDSLCPRTTRSATSFAATSARWATPTRRPTIRRSSVARTRRRRTRSIPTSIPRSARASAAIRTANSKTVCRRATHSGSCTSTPPRPRRSPR